MLEPLLMKVVTNPKLMLSTEIAALMGKNHQHVMRDIRVIVEQLQKDSPNLDCDFKSSTYLAGNGKQEKCYELDYQATMIVLTGYDVVARAKVIKRWQELETLAKLDEAPKVAPKPESSLIENYRKNLPHFYNHQS
jgi:phage regulator Rha-like protein